jgi:hypothetical protein
MGKREIITTGWIIDVAWKGCSGIVRAKQVEAGRAIA